MTLKLVTALIGGGLAIASGAAWLKSALVRYPIGVTWLDHAPADVTKKMEAQSWWNALAAVSASGAAFCQVLYTYLTY